MSHLPCGLIDVTAQGRQQQASPVKLSCLNMNPSVIIPRVTQLSGFPMHCKVTHSNNQHQFTCAMFHILTKPYFRPCRCQQRPWHRVDFPLIRRQDFFQSFGAESILGKQCRPAGTQGNLNGKYASYLNRVGWCWVITPASSLSQNRAYGSRTRLLIILVLTHSKQINRSSWMCINQTTSFL